MELSLINLVLLAVLYFAGQKGYQFYKEWKLQQMLDRWNNTPTDKLILHGVGRGKELPSISPFVLKVETYLRMANIPYEFEFSDPMGPKGKTPWISLNGVHIADSALIIQFLNKKFEKNLNAHLSPELKETSRALRVVLEEHFVWGIASWRYVENINSIDRIMKWPKIIILLSSFFAKKVEKTLKAQGLGIHSFKERTEISAVDLCTVSVILGNKKFIAGDQACEEDCGIFGVLAQVLWATPGSPYEKLMEDEYPNLKHYCLRMKEKYWSDWINCLDK